MSYKRCAECGQPILKLGQKREAPDDYRHARGCPLDSEDLPPGAEMDALVNVAIFGGTCARCGKRPAPRIDVGVVYCSTDCATAISDYALDDYEQNRPRYSERIEAAWFIVEKLAADHAKVAISSRIGKWGCSIILHVGTSKEAQFFEYGNTAPEAICRAALKTTTR